MYDFGPHDDSNPTGLGTGADKTNADLPGLTGALDSRNYAGSVEILNI